MFFCIFAKAIRLLTPLCQQKNGLLQYPLIMALNTNKDLKMYYSISEVAEQFGVTESLLRFWETEFPQLAPHKAGRNIRQYTKEDIETVRIIYHLVKVKGLKLAAARKVLEKNKDGAMNVADAIDRLKQMREELATFRKNLSSLTSGQEE